MLTKPGLLDRVEFLETLGEVTAFSVLGPRQRVRGRQLSIPVTSTPSLSSFSVTLLLPDPLLRVSVSRHHSLSSRCGGGTPWARACLCSVLLVRILPDCGRCSYQPSHSLLATTKGERHVFGAQPMKELTMHCHCFLS